jgi:hypothetical protein
VRLASAPEKADVRVMLPRSDVHQSQSRQFRTQSAPGVCRGERANYYPHVKRSLGLLKFRMGAEPEVNSFS